MRAILLLSAILAVSAADWPQWRGPNRDGKSPETGLLKSWPSEGPRLVWRATGLGEGYSSIAVAGGRIYTQGQRAGAQYVIALDAATGKKLWDARIGGDFQDRRGSGPRGVPTVDGDRLYAVAADGSLACLETATGKRIWSLSFTRDFGGSIPNWGYSESPLVDGERLIVTPGGRGAAVAALDKRTGKTIWKTQSDEAGYSSAAIAQVGANKLLLVLTGEAGIVLRADNGELVSRHTNVSNRTANIATPIYHDGHAFFSSDYGTGCTLVRLGAGGSKEVYFNRDMRNHYSSSVLVGEHLYGYSAQVLTAMKFATGEVAWRDRSVGKGSVIFAEGHLYVLGEDGAMGLVEATPAGYREKSRFTFPKGQYPTWAPPAIADGKLYIRDQDNLYCREIREKR
jgi:outer membrane protein assembly factor BamB